MRHHSFRIIYTLILFLFSGAMTIHAAKPTVPDSPPAWAYPVVPPLDTTKPPTPVPDTSALRKVPGSTVTLSLGNVKNLFSAPDWFPKDHPAMPEVVARGRKPDVYACGFCHRVEGTGGPENSSLAGLPSAYIVRQTREFKTGKRKSSLPDREPVRFMVHSAHGVTTQELKAAADYFAALEPRRNIRVIEADSAPVTTVVGWRLAVRPGLGLEPLGKRIIEVPDDEDRHVSRDPRVTYTAYAPKGSVAKGKALVETGGKGKTLACAACHGASLKGMGDVPGIAGRSTSYVVRQLYDFKHGTRAGLQAVMMQPVVAKLTTDDMIALAAYLGTLNP